MMNWRGPILRSYVLAAIAALVFFSSAWIGRKTGAEWYSYVNLPAAFAGTVAVLLLSRSDALSGSRLLGYLGQRAMAIYVMHVIFLAGTRIVLVRGLHCSNAAIILPIIVLVGLAVPLAIDRVARGLRLQAVLGLG